MKKAFLLILLALLTSTSLLAQYSPCYETAFAEGKKLYSSGQYILARKYFIEARGCPDPNTAAANEWIGKCDIKIKEAAKIKMETEAAKTAYMEILRMDYCNVERNGQMIDDYGATFYPSKMKCLQPRITYNALLDETREATVYIKVINPNNILVTGKSSPSGYTYSAKVHVTPGKDKTVMLSTWDNNGLTFSAGKYKYELWYNETQLYSSSFIITEDKPEPVVVIPPTPVEKKAEIKVTGKDGKALEGAKLLVIGTGKYEWTNSDGIGRIDLSDMDTKRVEISHADYQDKKEISVYVGDQRKVSLNQLNSKSTSGVGVVHYIVPGTYQMKIGKTAEGVAFMGGEIILLSSGFISNAIANKQMKVMQNEDVSLADFQKAKRNYKIQRALNIASFTSATLVYAAHLYRTYSLSSKSGSKLSMAPSVICVGDEMAFGMNINFTF